MKLLAFTASAVTLLVTLRLVAPNTKPVTALEAVPDKIANEALVAVADNAAYEAVPERMEYEAFVAVADNAAYDAVPERTEYEALVAVADNAA